MLYAHNPKIHSADGAQTGGDPIIKPSEDEVEEQSCEWLLVILWVDTLIRINYFKH